MRRIAGYSAWEGSAGRSGPGGTGHDDAMTRRDTVPREFDSVASPRRGAQSRDADTSKTRTRRRIMTCRVIKRGGP